MRTPPTHQAADLIQDICEGPLASRNVTPTKNTCLNILKLSLGDSIRLTFVKLYPPYTRSLRDAIPCVPNTYCEPLKVSNHRGPSLIRAPAGNVTIRNKEDNLREERNSRDFDRKSDEFQKSDSSYPSSSPPHYIARCNSDTYSSE